MKSYLTQVRDNKIRNGYIHGKQGCYVINCNLSNLEQWGSYQSTCTSLYDPCSDKKGPYAYSVMHSTEQMITYF